MQVGSVGYVHTNDKALKNAKIHYNESKNLGKEDERSIEDEINSAAVKVSISMNAQVVLVNLESTEASKKNSLAQSGLTNIVNSREILDFLSGKDVPGSFSLQDIGYEGKPITELSADEAKRLIADDGFFGIIQTSNRVSSFVFSLAGDSLELLKEARAGIINGFKEAEAMWGGNLPTISYETQNRTLELIDKRIAELEYSYEETEETAATE